LTTDELVGIGEITGVYGYKGWVKVIPLTSFPDRFYKLQEIVITKNECILKTNVEEVKPYGNIFLVKLQAFDSRETARDYIKGILNINESEVFPLEEGYYYHFQLQGLDVYDETKGYLGCLKDIIQTGANDVYVIESKEYGEVLIPAIKEVITKIDLDNKAMQVKLLPGLIPD